MSYLFHINPNITIFKNLEWMAKISSSTSNAPKNLVLPYGIVRIFHKIIDQTYIMISSTFDF